MKNVIDITGETFGRFTAIEYTGDGKWLCECTCGKEKVVKSYNLRSGLSKSCGCLQKEVATTMKTTHGQSGTAEYRMWNAAKERAKKYGLPFSIEPTDIYIPDYCPALGILLTVEAHVQTDHSPTLDRIQPDLGYVKGNIAVISMRANRIKNDATAEELRQITDWLHGLTD